MVLVRRASEALTGRPEAPAPLSEDARQPLQPEQVYNLFIQVLLQTD